MFCIVSRKSTSNNMFSTLTRFSVLLLGIAYVICPSVTIDVDGVFHSKWELLEHENCGNPNTDRIVGGRNASLGAYPWIARIGYTLHLSNYKVTEYRCGGSLINKNYVVTAAHCVENFPKWLTLDSVRLGEHNTLSDPDCEEDYCAEPVQDFKVVSIIRHENYNSPTFRNDIAILRLNRPVIYNEFIMPICMPHGPLLVKDFIGETAEVAGWGIYDMEQSKTSTILQTVTLPILHINECMETFRKMIQLSQYQICAGGVIGEDSCNGDSGGPLMKVENIDRLPRYYLIGLVSFGMERCGSGSIPGVYTKMSYYVNWILDNIYP